MAALVWVRAPDIFMALLKVMAPELVTVTVVKPVVSEEVPDPYMAATPIVPVPEFKVSVSAELPVVPVVVPLKVMFPAPADP